MSLMQGLCRMYRGDRGTRFCSANHYSEGTVSYVWLDSTLTRCIEKWYQSGRRIRMVKAFEPCHIKQWPKKLRLFSPKEKSPGGDVRIVPG